MLALGDFVFARQSAPFQQLRRTGAERWGSNNRLHNRPGYQHLGPGEETLSLSGVLHPGVTGGRLSLDELRTMQESGSARTSIDGAGHLYGRWVITDLQQTSSLFFNDGQARRIEFTLSLTRVDDDGAG